MTHNKNYLDAIKFAIDGNATLKECGQLDQASMQLIDDLGKEYDRMAHDFKGLSEEQKKKNSCHLDEIQLQLGEYIDHVARLREKAKEQINTAQSGRKAHKAYRVAQS